MYGFANHLNRSGVSVLGLAFTEEDEFRSSGKRRKGDFEFSFFRLGVKKRFTSVQAIQFVGALMAKLESDGRLSEISLLPIHQ
ncbi:MAG: hypothetical protein C5B49_11615 [Bdellovibrio sp.]|nr:MAG: hypothetical protein C5B49_11615 [Bdellovibrio sp.]